MVAIESWIDDDVPVIRDEDAKPFIRNDRREYYHMKKFYHSEDKTFTRQYVQLNSFEQLKMVNMSRTGISSDGIVSLMAAAGRILEDLDISHCSRIDNKIIHAIAKFAQRL